MENTPSVRGGREALVILCRVIGICRGSIGRCLILTLSLSLGARFEGVARARVSRKSGWPSSPAYIGPISALLSADSRMLRCATFCALLALWTRLRAVCWKTFASAGTIRC